MINPFLELLKLCNKSSEVLDILLIDRTTEKNILWMTDNYSELGKEFTPTSEINLSHLVETNFKIIKPRTTKSSKEQLLRIRDKGEVFTPSWVCNKQINLIDETWFEYADVFNKEKNKKWVTRHEKVQFPENLNRSWKDYVIAQRLEITCGEGPYLVSRYDTATGKPIPVKDRIGLFDRKLRIVSENVSDKGLWINWGIKATQSVYGYEWQGDSLLLARLNILLSFVENYMETFNNEKPTFDVLLEIANIVSWNLWQMDGMKFVVPMSCNEKEIVEKQLFEDKICNIKCEGCEFDSLFKHNGAYCLIKDWENDVILKAVSLLKE